MAALGTTQDLSQCSHIHVQPYSTPDLQDRLRPLWPLTFLLRLSTYSKGGVLGQ